MSDRLTTMEVFVSAMRLGSLSAAARHMGMSSTMAARHLAQLEERLGVTLVNRTTRRLSLTEAGAAYLERAERLLGEWREVENEVSARSTLIEGLLRVSTPVTFGTMHVAPLVAEFGLRQPGVTIELGLNDRYVDLLEERWDVAIRVGRLADSTLVARKLAPARLVVCAAPDYLARRGTPMTVEQLREHVCLGYTLSPLVSDSQWSFGPDGSVRVPVRGALRANNGEAIIHAARLGLGIAYQPRFMTAPFLASGELIELPLDRPVLELGGVYAVTHPTRRPAARTRAWIEFLGERMPHLSADW